MANVYNDGNIPYGSQVVTLNATTYVAEDINFEDTTKTIDRADEIGNPNGAVYIKQKVTGTMTLQLATTSTAIPAVNDTVSLTYRGSAKTFVVSKVGQPQKQDDIRKIQVEVAEVLNP